MLAALSPRIAALAPSTRLASSRTLVVGGLPLLVGAVATLLATIAFDVLADEHPTHTLGLALITLVATGLRLRLTGRREGLLSVVAAVVSAQPALHVAAKIDAPTLLHSDEGVLHVVAADGPTTAMQMAVSVIVVIAAALVGQLARLLLTALRRPVQLLMTGPPRGPLRVSLRARTQRSGTMLRWCGWSIRSARRGPPGLVVG